MIDHEEAIVRIAVDLFVTACRLYKASGHTLSLGTKRVKMRALP